MTLDQYISFLRDAKFVGGFPMLAGGLGLMLFGWRMWRLCLVVVFGAIGLFTTAYFTRELENQWWYATSVGMVIGLAAYYPAKHAVAFLGGLIVAAIAHLYLLMFALEPGTHWAIVGAVMFGGTAYAAINRRRVVIVVTAFIGAILLMSGLACWVLAFPSFFNTMLYLAERSAIVIPFLLLVPTAMSCFYQISEVRRVQAEL